MFAPEWVQIRVPGLAGPRSAVRVLYKGGWSGVHRTFRQTRVVVAPSVGRVAEVRLILNTRRAQFGHVEGVMMNVVVHVSHRSLQGATAGEAGDSGKGVGRR